MEPNNNTPNTNQQIVGMLADYQFLSGIIKPRHLAASTTMAAGDLYFVNANGIFQRLPIGTAGQTLKVSSALLPYWG